MELELERTAVMEAWGHGSCTAARMQQQTVPFVTAVLVQVRVNLNFVGAGGRCAVTASGSAMDVLDCTTGQAHVIGTRSDTGELMQPHRANRIGAGR